jgi:hypothetical protein
MRPEDFERYRKMIRDAERMRRSLGDTSQIQRMVREVEQATRMARGAGNLGSSPADIESLRREVEIAQWLSDPQILRAHADAHRIVAQYNSAVAKMPDAATQRAILEAARPCTRNRQKQRIFVQLRILHKKWSGCKMAETL